MHQQIPISSRSKPIIEVDGLRFRDLNGDGGRTPYEDWRRSPSERLTSAGIPFEGPSEMVASMHMRHFSLREEPTGSRIHAAGHPGGGRRELEERDRRVRDGRPPRTSPSPSGPAPWAWQRPAPSR